MTNAQPPIHQLISPSRIQMKVRTEPTLRHDRRCAPKDVQAGFVNQTMISPQNYKTALNIMPSTKLTTLPATTG